MTGRIRIFAIIILLVTSSTIASMATVADSLELRSIQILGNERTKDNYILRELSVELGQKIPEEQLEKVLERSRQNIFNLKLFISVSLEKKVDEGFLDLKIIVKERLYLLPLPIFFLADRNFNEWWYDRNRDLSRTIYGIQLNHANLTGNGDELKLKAYAGFIPYAEVSYNKPYIDKRQRMGLRGGLFFSTQKTLPFRTWNDKLDFYNTEKKMRERKGAFVEYNLRNGLYHFHNINLGFTAISINDSIVTLNENYLGDNGTRLNYFGLSYEYRYDKRDNFQYPLKGQVFQAKITKYGLGVFKDADQVDINTTFVKYIPLPYSFFLDFGFRGKFSYPQRQLYVFTAGLGYRNTLVRGYQLNVIDGQNYGLLSTNLKWKVFEKSFDLSKFLRIQQFNTIPVATFAKLFGDLGYVQNFYPELSNSSLSNKLLWGGGVGLDVVTYYDTAFDINYSINQFGNSKFFFTVRRGL